MSYLLDTNVLSELRKPVRNRGLLDWLATTHQAEHFVSVLTIGELHRGVSRLRDRGDRRQAEVIERFVRGTERRFAARILPITSDIAVEWGRQAHGSSIPSIDGLIAATAMVHRMAVVTRNSRDFEPTGAEVLDPFTA